MRTAASFSVTYPQIRPFLRTADPVCVGASRDLAPEELRSGRLWRPPLRPLPSSPASSLRDNLYPTGPSPCPSPRVDTSSGASPCPLCPAASLPSPARPVILSAAKDLVLPGPFVAIPGMTRNLSPFVIPDLVGHLRSGQRQARRRALDGPAPRLAVSAEPRNARRWCPKHNYSQDFSRIQSTNCLFPLFYYRAD